MSLARRSLCLPLLALALLALPGQALGAANHPFLGAINGGYEDACGVGFGPGGLYVSDYHHNAIVGPTSILGEDPSGGPCKLAFDSAGDLYVNNWHHNVVKYAEPFSAGTGAVIDSAQPTGLAVDQATGDVYVAHRTYVAAYEASGAPVEVGGEPVRIGLEPSAEYFGVAVSEFPATDGDLYVPDAATGTVKVFDSAGAPSGEIEGAGTPQGGFVHLVDAEVAVDNSPASPSYGHVFVLDAIGHGLSEHPEAVLDEFNATGAYRGQIAGFTDAEPSGIAFQDSTHNVYVTSGNSEGSAVFIYGPTAPARSLKVTKTGSGGGSVSGTPAGIACGTACAAEYNEGQTVTLFAAPDAHSAFAGWSVSGSGAEPCPGLGSCTVLLSANREVSASFTEPTQEALTVSTTGGGEGRVSSEPAGISCPGTCTEHFNQGRLVTLSATPAPHSRFAGWSGPDCDESTALTCKVEMTAAKAIDAEFEPIPQLSLSVSKTGTGQGTVTSYPAGISCPGACSASFDQGSTVYLLAAPALGSGFGGFSGGCSGTGPICALTLSSAQAVVAEFTGTALGPMTPAAANTATLRVGAVATQGRLASLSLVASEPGTLLAAGSGLRPREISLEAGAASLRLRLNHPASRLLHRRHRLRARLTLGFLPADGDEATTRTLALHFRAAGPRNFDRKGR
jgi:DNA-binding beta-propeller fold protein YncE